MGLLLFLDPFQLIPVFQHLRRTGNLHLPEHVGVTVDQLFTHTVGSIGQIKVTGFLFHLGVKHHLKQHVAQFFFQVIDAALINGFYHLVGFLQKIATGAFVGLLGIPGTSTGCAQNCHEVFKILSRVVFFPHKIYHISVPSASSFTDFCHLIRRIFAILSPFGIRERSSQERVRRASTNTTYTTAATPIPIKVASALPIYE